MRYTVAIAVGLSAIMAGLSGCASEVAVTETMRRPAEINMAGYERVTIRPIAGPGGEKMTARLKQALVQAKFEVLERDQRVLADRGREKNLEELGGTAPEQGGAQGIIKAGVLIKGSVLQHGCTHTSKVQRCVQNNVAYTNFSDVADATVEVSFDVVDLATTKLIVSKSITGRQTVQSQWASTPGHLDEGPLYDECYKQVIAQFRNALSPHNVTVVVRLFKVDKVPANDSGIALFQAKDYANAVTSFESGLDAAKALPEITPRDLSRICHNIGLSLEFGGQYPSALARYDEAIRIEPDPAYQNSVIRCKKQIENAEKLKEQGDSAK